MYDPAALPSPRLAASADPVGLLLVSLGTPDAPEPGPVRRYLREFLSDPRVLDLPAPLRFLLLEAVILPRRPRASAAAYRQIWTAAGSPLLVHGRALAAKLQQRFDAAGPYAPPVRVELAMRYGQPAIAAALDRLAAAGACRLVVLPLYPQYSAAATGSALARVMELAAARWNVPYLQVVPPFYAHPAYLDARAAVLEPVLAAHPEERVVMSFHGVPERQVRKGDPSGRHCLVAADCCAAIGPHNRQCYRAQCLESARLVAARLELAPERYLVAFQSRLGRSPWLRPATEEVLAAEASRGVRQAVVLSPGFVLDCLETLEELGVRGAETWRRHGGERLTVAPALNASDAFADALVAIARDASPWIAGAT